MFTYADFFEKYANTDISNKYIINSYINTDIATTKSIINENYGVKNAYPKPKKIFYDEDAGVTVVLWKDDTKTIVRAAEDDINDPYYGYCVALAKKIHGTNSALKRELNKVLVVKQKNEDYTDSFKPLTMAETADKYSKIVKKAFDIGDLF